MELFPKPSGEVEEEGVNCDIHQGQGNPDPGEFEERDRHAGLPLGPWMKITVLAAPRSEVSRDGASAARSIISFGVAPR
jgi:hypothetical protein